MRIRGFRKALGILIGLLSITVVIEVLTARSSAAQNNGNPSILDAIHTLQSTVDALTTSVNSLKTDVSTIKNSVGGLAPSKVQATSVLVYSTADQPRCQLSNISPVTQQVLIEMILINGIVLETDQKFVNAGDGLIQTGPPPTSGSPVLNVVYCKFTVLTPNGTKDSIRGALALGANLADRLLLPAE